MIDFNSLPTSEAESLKEITLINSDYEFTYTECVDEKKLYKEISMRLIALEKSLEVNKNELESINHMVKGFQVANDEKEEVLLRIDWLHRLYKAKEEIGTIDTKEQAKQLRRMVSPVQTCPMKKQLMSEIDSLEQSLPEENVMSSEPSIEHQLMEMAIEEVGDIFINLGKVGREFVISDVLEQFGDNLSVENVKEKAIVLEQSVKRLSEVNGRTELITHLEQLPLQSFTGLEAERKDKIVDRLLENSKWNGLASLDRTIAQIDRVIIKEERDKEEAENTVLTNDGKVAFTLDIGKNGKGIVQLG